MNFQQSEKQDSYRPAGNSGKFSEHKALLGVLISMPNFRSSEIYVVTYILKKKGNKSSEI